MRVLELIIDSGPLRFAELEEQSGLPKASLHRCLGELVDEQLLSYDEGSRRWSAGYRILELANRIWTRSDIRMLCRDQLLALSALSGETVQVAVHADTHVVVIDHVESHQSVRHSISVGNRAPAYCTGIGKVLLAWCGSERQKDVIERTSFARLTPNTIVEPAELLAELARVSEAGVAVDDEEHCLGTRCIAAPVVDASGAAIAGISITAPTFRVSYRHMMTWRDPLVAAAAEVSRRLAPRTGRPGDARSAH